MVSIIGIINARHGPPVKHPNPQPPLLRNLRNNTPQISE